MLSEKIIIAERNQLERLTPVLTYVNGHSQQKAINAWLSFLSTCRNDVCNQIRFPDILSPEDECTCHNLLNAVFDTFIRVECLSNKVNNELTSAVYKIIKGLTGESLQFLEKRYIEICGQYSFKTYWCQYEKASTLEEIIAYRESALNAMQDKNFINASIFFISLALVYGCGNDFFELFRSSEDELRNKYGNSIPSKQLCLCLWTIDFSFVEEKQYTDSNDEFNEHLALLRAIQSINPDVQVQTCFNSRLWSRDMIAWVDDNHEFYINTVSDDIYDRTGSGLLNEGGNIITGTAKNKFVLVAQSPLTDNFTEIYFYQEMDTLGIRAYTLPDGFIWARNPETKTDCVLDSIHIDTVINCIPAWCTLDEKLKVIIDPCYYEMIKQTSEFQRFLKDQKIETADIIIVDKREQYLNLPNFSIILSQKGEKILLFNKDKGYTLPCLNLKPGIMVQPEIEIVNISSFFGTIRCATNMLPESFVITPGLSVITLEDTIPDKTKERLLYEFKHNSEIIYILKKLWVKHVNIITCKGKKEWDFDDFSRSAYIYISLVQASDPYECCVLIGASIRRIAVVLSRQMGIP
jgi:hypothetical protein